MLFWINTFYFEKHIHIQLLVGVKMQKPIIIFSFSSKYKSRLGIDFNGWLLKLLSAFIEILTSSLHAPIVFS